jgi:hypothetical protein
MTTLAKIRRLLRDRPLTADRLRALHEAKLAKEHLRNVKTASRSLAGAGSQQIDGSRRGGR